MLKGDSDCKGKEEVTPLPQEQQEGSRSSHHDTAAARSRDGGQQSKGQEALNQLQVLCAYDVSSKEAPYLDFWKWVLRVLKEKIS